MPTQALETPKSFEERMMSRIKESIGEMITDDELKKIVEKGIEMAFFEPPLITEHYGTKTYGDCLALKAVREFAEKKVSVAINEWLEKNPEKIAQILDAVVRDGLAQIMLDSINAKTSDALFKLSQELQQRLSH